jgi:hypothetical protein
MSTTWKYLDEVINPNLASVGLEVKRIKASEWSYIGELAFNKTGELLIPAFSSQSTKPAKLSNFCTRWWKQDVMTRYLSSVGLTRSKYFTWIGFSLNESKRVARMMAGEEFTKGLIRFPLVERRIKRQEAIRIVELNGWPTPPRSKCYMCPNQTDSEWENLRNHYPEDFAKAVAFEKEFQLLDPEAWLHKSCKPLDTVKTSEGPTLWDGCDSGVCFL